MKSLAEGGGGILYVGRYAALAEGAEGEGGFGACSGEGDAGACSREGVGARGWGVYFEMYM